ncbi:DUF2130 domain-containing protein [Spiroplasma endosymbiont of Polydrusus cervinus]|uniref:DUF2130 domain-containing protein n=1 Tax=Spiroplasma endosymbiont of Polydrusus cervinus TaxID=3066287 RepID=UPI0030CF8429
MKWEFTCPNCGYIITEEDFSKNEKILANLKSIFDKHKDIYIQNLREKLIIDLQEQQKEELSRIIAEKENQFNKIKQEELDKLNQIITNQSIELSNNKINLEKLLVEKENSINLAKQKEIDDLKEHIAKLSTLIENNKLELDKTLAEKENQFNKIKQEELDKLNQIITNQSIELSNNKVNLEKLLIEKENSINLAKQKEIDDLKEHIAKLSTLIENNKLELDKTLAEKENQFNKIKQEELDKLNQIITNQSIELSNNKVNLEKLLVEKENQLMNKQQEIILNYEKELKILNFQVEELKIANATNKVIQNKTKGENFEHEVYGELLKVFEDDKVTKITSQDKKADYLQKIITDNKKIGKIVYEVKNAEWSNAWEKKLVEDMAKQDSKYGILVATSFNKKYPGIPFKKSDENPNIYLCDADSFIFVGQILRSMIKIENKLDSQKQITNYDEKIKAFTSWKEVHLPKLIKMFEDSFMRIKEAEASITKKVDEIRIAREKMHNNALHNIREFLEEFNF